MKTKSKYGYECDCCGAVIAQEQLVLDSYYANLCTLHKNELNKRFIEDPYIKDTYSSYLGLRAMGIYNTDSLSAAENARSAMDLTPALVQWAEDFIQSYQDEEDAE